MPRSKIDPNGMIDRFRYSPGDQHTYAWPGAGDWIVVYRHVHRDHALWLQDTGDRINAASIERTAGAMSILVDEWRQSRVGA